MYVVIAESHKTLQAKICDILFPCGDQATNRGPVWGEVGKDLSCRKTCGSAGGVRRTSKTEVTARACCKKQSEKKKTLPKALAKEFGDKFSQVIKNLRSSLSVCIAWFSGSWEI